MNTFWGPPKREPSAVQRRGADDLHSQYISYVDAGFSKQQAMQIVLQMIASAVESQRPQPPS